MPDTHDDALEERFRSVLEGLRTTLPGTQVLVGFLLVLPFQASFDQLGGFGEALFLVAFASAAMSSILLIAPSVHQRVRAPASGVERNHESHLESAIRITNVGTALLAVALITTVALVVGQVTSVVTGALVAAPIALALGYTWAWQPLVAFREHNDSPD